MQPANCSRRISQQLQRFVKSRFALSTVVTSLIILVISVLLAGVVTYFAINVTSTRVQEESLALTKQHVWYDYSNGKAQAAIMVINAGGRDVVVDKLTVRGQVCDWSKVFYALASDSVSGDLFANSTLVDGGSISVGGQNRVFKQATNDLTVQSGRTLIIYMDNPDSISVNDVGLTVSVNIFTSQAMYYKETNVQGTGGGTTSTSSQSVPLHSEYILLHSTNAVKDDRSGQTHDLISFIIVNSGSTSETIDIASEVTIDSQTIPGPHVFTYVGEIPIIPTLMYTTEPDGYYLGSYALAASGNQVTIPPGETAIIYVQMDENTLLVNEPVSLRILLDDGSDIVQDVPYTTWI